MQNISDLRDCATEPIHAPGHIQPHGILFALDLSLETTHVSRNAASWHHDRTTEQLLGTPIAELVRPAGDIDLCSHLLDPDIYNYNPVRAQFGSGEFNLIGHRRAGHLIVELEEVRPAASPVSLSPYHLVRRAISKMRQSRSLEDLGIVVAKEVKRVTGFSRVLIYRFCDNWDGEVILEERDEHVASFAGLRFPASDIPPQARQLYTECTQRIIPNVNYTPVLVQGRVPGEPLDLSLSVLRSISPFHLQYMRNMGVKSSMSVSIIHEGRLWGLISCADDHNERSVPFDIRASCDFISENMSLLIESKEGKDRARARQRANNQMTRLLRQTANVDNFVDGLLHHDVNIAQLVPADGAAVVYGSGVECIGRTPDARQIRQLVAWLVQNQSSQVWATTSLMAHFAPAAQYRSVGCGLISGKLSVSRGEFILWFRREAEQVIHWGGNPNKQSLLTNGSINPRSSFDRWTETVTEHSSSWSDGEKRTAADLVRSVIDIILKSSEELTVLNSELARSNTELDAFAYAASHDLKEPLRGISNFSALVLRDLDSTPSSQAMRSKLETVIRLTRRMDALIDALLRFSHLGRTEIEALPVNLENVVQDTLEVLQLRVDEKSAHVEVHGALPTVQGNSALIQEVFANLLTNALKYNNSSAPKIRISSEQQPEQVTISIHDNGIGIPERHQQDVFKIFRRLHARTAFGGGTGSGLTIASRIIERHGGKIWVTSSPGAGSTFHFSLRTLPARQGERGEAGQAP